LGEDRSVMTTLQDKGSEALQELMNEAEMIATAMIRETGEMRAAIFIHGQEGKTIFRPKSMATEAAKDEYAADARIVCMAEGADAVVYCSEAWMLSPKTGRSVDLTMPPSKSPDRQEVLVLMGESREGYLHKSLPICRSESGKFAGFGEATELWPDRVEGRFGQLLSEEKPSADERELAKLILHSRGLTTYKKKRREQGHGRGIF